MSIDIKKINWKIYFEDANKVDADAFFRGFASWIENSEEVFVDVAEYKHVHDGPITVLIGHLCDYWLDGTFRRRGLLYNQRQNFEGDNRAQIRKSLFALINAAERVSAEEEFGGVGFKADELTFTINDRLIAPNTAETFAEISEQINADINKSGMFELIHNDDPKQRFSITLKAEEDLSVADLKSKLAS